MATVVEIETGRLGYRTVVDHVVKHGRPRSPRGVPTLDAGMVTVVIADPRDALPLGVGRNLDPKIAAIEAIQLIAGRACERRVEQVTPALSRFFEDNGQQHGAYGRRIGTQLMSAVNKLRSDTETRQAIITLWDPWLDNQPGKRDYPCTVSLGFAVNDGALDLNVLMRSNDVWLGFPYDIFQFTQLQLTVAHALEMSPGTYTHSAWSMHIYESDYVKVSDLTVASEQIKPFLPEGIGTPEHSLPSLLRRAQILLGGNAPHNTTTSEVWYDHYLNG